MSPKLKNTPLFLTVFITGACVMVVEITASRIIAPFFGASLYVWTNVIGVILAALALGYWVGGRLAESTKSARLLSEIILGAGVCLLLAPFLFKIFARIVTVGLLALNSSGASIVFFGSLIVLVVLFALPVVLLGTVSPFVIRLVTLEETDVGNVSGRVFAIGTLGSIIGTFLPTLLLVPAIGSARTIFLAGAALLILGACGMMKNRRHLVMLSMVVVCMAFIVPKTLRARPGFLYEEETPFQYLSVQDQADFGRTMIFNEGLGIQSLLLPKTGKTGLYWDYVPPLLGTTASTSVRQALIIGVAGGTIPQEIANDWGSAVEMTGAEVDAAVLRVAHDYFGLGDVKHFTPVLQDGRTLLAYNKKKYDFILLDAFTNQLYIPPHLTTIEFFTIVRDHLSEHGTLAINAALAKEDSVLYKRLMATLKKVFPHVYVTKLQNSMNWLVVASVDEKKWADFEKTVPVSEQTLAKEIGFGMQEIKDIHADLLTDDNAPIELLTDKEIFDVLMTQKE